MAEQRYQELKEAYREANERWCLAVTPEDRYEAHCACVKAGARLQTYEKLLRMRDGL